MDRFAEVVASALFSKLVGFANQREYGMYADNQMGENAAGFATSGQQLAQELEEVSSSSRRSTLRKHYTVLTLHLNIVVTVNYCS